MEKIKLSEISAGNSYKGLVLVTDMQERVAKNGKPFMVISLSDGETAINATMFNASAGECGDLKGKVCTASIDGSLYSNALSVTIPNKDLKQAEEGTYNLADFIIKAPISSEVMYDKIVEVIGGCKSSLKDVALNIYEENKEQLMRHGAARAVHHNYYGGLLYHTYRMLSHATVVCKIYTNLNRDLLLIGTVLHDIGKLRELETDSVGASNYTIEGNLFGHLLLGIEMVNAEVAKQPENYVPEEVSMLKHMIAGHHGPQEFGSIREPATMEAIALNFIDNMDARMETCDKGLESIEKGKMMDKKLVGIDAFLYRPML